MKPDEVRALPKKECVHRRDGGWYNQVMWLSYRITNIPRWACIFNIVPLFLATFPFHIGGMGNWCGAAMFIGLLILL